MKILERLNLFEVKTGGASPVCKKLHLKLEEQFQNNVLQSKIWTTLKIPSSTIQNIIKSLNNLEKSMLLSKNP